MKETADGLIALYSLETHPEGGFFRESYRAGGKTGTERGERNFSTAIYFLLKEGQVSRLHRIKADEVWHFYAGGPLTVAGILPDGRVEETVLGRDTAAGQKFQYAVPAGRWFGAYPNPGTGFSFVGCTVAPGFEFADFEMGDRGKLLKEFPAAKKIIEKLTKGIK
ncbi:MAG: cupin [Elusimicrobia bacterium GWC2_61_19]|nr:MAG: cupin [Elusimicrobia bacterium GWC2_61_19]